MATEIDTTAAVTIGGERVHVLVCAIDERHGIRVTNRMWGGRLDAWVQANELTVANGPHD